LPLLSGMSKKEVSKSSFAGVVCLTVSELTAALTLGIPAILIDGNVVPDDEWEGITAILDCRRKRLVLAPDLSELERYSEQGRESEYRSEELERLADKLSVTLSGRRIYLASELRRGMKLSGYHLSGGDAETLLVTDGADAGMDLAGFEEDQYSLFKRSAASDAEVTVRLLGMPSDGGGSFARSGILGLRGAGLFALFRPVYKAQLRAILRGSAHGGISVLLPDVCCEGELGHFRSMLREARGELKGEGGPIGEIKRFGIELSTPAAILESEKLTQGADIVVIDIDRLAGLVSASELIDPIAEDQLRAGIPSVLRLCRQAIDGIRVGGRRFGIRGSLAAEPELTAALIECGFDSFFLPPDAVLPVKERVLTCGGH